MRETEAGVVEVRKSERRRIRVEIAATKKEGNERRDDKELYEGTAKGE